MKYLSITLLAAISAIACAKEPLPEVMETCELCETVDSNITNNNDSNANSNNNYFIEGRWTYEGFNLNTMYEFINGKRYTYYCSSTALCDSTYWNSLDSNDAIPGWNNYTFDGDTLIIDLNFGNMQVLPLIFECNGNIINFQDPLSPSNYDWWRVGIDTTDC